MCSPRPFRSTCGRTSLSRTWPPAGDMLFRAPDGDGICEGERIVQRHIYIAFVLFLLEVSME